MANNYIAEVRVRNDVPSMYIYSCKPDAETEIVKTDEKNWTVLFAYKTKQEAINQFLFGGWKVDTADICGVIMSRPEAATVKEGVSMTYFVDEVYFNDEHPLEDGDGSIIGTLNMFQAEDNETAIQMFSKMNYNCPTLLFNEDEDGIVAIKRDGEVYNF